MPIAASRADKIIVSDVRAALASAADPDKAIGMQAYMKSALPFRGVQSRSGRVSCARFRIAPITE